MGNTTLVDQRIEEARKLVDCLTREGRLDVTAAYWIEVQDSDDREWTFHIVTPTYEERGTKDPDHLINIALTEHPEIDFDSVHIWTHPIDDRKVVEILNFLRNYPASRAFQLRGVYFKGRWVERSCIFPIKIDDMVVSADQNGF